MDVSKLNIYLMSKNTLKGIKKKNLLTVNLGKVSGITQAKLILTEICVPDDRQRQQLI